MRAGGSLFAVITGLAFAAGPVFALDIDFEGNIEIEYRHFASEGGMADGPMDITPDTADPEREQSFASLSGEIGLGFYTRSNRHAVILRPFARYDEHDHERTHGDLREAKYRYLRRPFELTVGLDKEFWGVTEFMHLVDIINQTDAVESVDGEAKLGQPMVKLAYSSPYGTLTAYHLPVFRIRQFSDPITGRPNYGYIVDDEMSLFESDKTGGDARRVDDMALRYKHSIGPFDVGLSWFDGTAREPQLLVTGQARLDNNLPVMQAYYADYSQAGLDIQATLGPWLFKLEAISGTENRKQNDPVFMRPTPATALEEITTTRATGGFEYTFYNLFNSGTDLGLVSEYLWDEREAEAPHPFGNEVGIGLRWTANDTQSTAILVGGFVDLDSDSIAMSLEAERRIGASFKAVLEARAQSKVGENDVFAAANKDEDFIRLRFGYYF